MITWTLWSALHHPPTRQAVFRRYANRHIIPRRGRLPVFILIAFLASYICYQVAVVGLPLGMAFFVTNLDGFAALLVFLNLVWGCYLAAGISQSIATTRASGLYDLLCLTPPGAPGVAWAIALGTLHRRSGLDWFRFGLTLVCGVLLIALTVLLAVPVIGIGATILRPAASPNELSFYVRMFIDLTEAFTLVVAVYLGALQTVVMAVLVGILAPLVLKDPSSARPLSVAVFFLLQLCLLLITLFFALLLPRASSLIDLEPYLELVLQALINLAFFVAVREILNAALWQLLLRQVGAQRDVNIAWAAGQV